MRKTDRPIQAERMEGWESEKPTDKERESERERERERK